MSGSREILLLCGLAVCVLSFASGETAACASGGVSDAKGLNSYQDSPSFKRQLTLGPLRVLPYYMDMSALSPDLSTRIKEKVIPAVISRLATDLSAYNLNQNLLISQEICGTQIVPKVHQTHGMSDTDVVIYIYAQSDSNNSYLFRAGICAFDIEDYPIALMLQYNPLLYNDSLTVDNEVLLLKEKVSASLIPMYEESAGCSENECQEQIISGSDHRFHAEKLARFRIRDKGERMRVISIIGSQGIGKSTFLNQCYNAKFSLLQTTRVQKTTDGVSLFVSDGGYLLDFEGFDSQQDGSEIENQLPLFAFYVSDVVLIYIETMDLGHIRNSWFSMLRIVLGAGLKTGKLPSQKTLIIALLRNPSNLKAKTLGQQRKELEAQAQEYFEDVWLNVEGNDKGRHFLEVFNFKAVPLRYDSGEGRLYEDDLELVRTTIRDSVQNFQTDYQWISRHWENSWKEIVTSGTLDTPEFQQFVGRERLELQYQKFKPALLQLWTTRTERISNFDPKQELESLKNESLDNLSSLLRTLRYQKKGEKHILEYILSDLSPIVEHERLRHELREKVYQNLLLEVLDRIPEYETDSFNHCRNVKADTLPGLIPIRMRATLHIGLRYDAPRGWTITQHQEGRIQLNGDGLDKSSVDDMGTAIVYYYKFYHPVAEFGNSHVDICITGQIQRLSGYREVHRTPEEARKIAEATQLSD